MFMWTDKKVTKTTSFAETVTDSELLREYKAKQLEKADAMVAEKLLEEIGKQNAIYEKELERSEKLAASWEFKVSKSGKYLKIWHTCRTFAKEISEDGETNRSVIYEPILGVGIIPGSPPLRDSGKSRRIMVSSRPRDRSEPKDPNWTFDFYGDPQPCSPVIVDHHFERTYSLATPAVPSRVCISMRKESGVPSFDIYCPLGREKELYEAIMSEISWG